MVANWLVADLRRGEITINHIVTLTFKRRGRFVCEEAMMIGRLSNETSKFGFVIKADNGVSYHRKITESLTSPSLALRQRKLRLFPFLKSTRIIK